MLTRLADRFPGWFAPRSLALLALLSLAPTAGDVTRGDDAAAAAPAPVTTADPDVSPEHLRFLVKPLTKDELGVEAAAWRDVLKAKVAEISRLQFEAKQAAAGVAADAEQAAADPAAVNKLQAERTLLMDRLRAVLDEWEKKGGDPAEYRAYSSAVSGLDVDVSDAGATLKLLQGWVFSEQGGLRWAWNIIKFVTILAAFWLLSRILSGLVGKAAAQIRGTSSLLKTFLVNFVRQATLAIGGIVALAALEVNISPLLALIGGAAFVVGLALQGTLSNFAQGLIILAYRPFDVGDVIDAGGVSGVVESMNMLSTTIRTFDNKVVIVPNGKVGGDTITNATASDTRRVDLTFGIGYADDVDKAEAVLTKLVTDHPLVLADPAPVIKLNELADSSVNFVVRPWTKTADYWTVYWDLIKGVKQAFDREGISIPFPQRDVHLHQS
jgi:small conductance mechanosensitive channel